MHLPLPLCFLSSLSIPGLWVGLTINHHCGWQAPPLGYDVGRHACIISGVREPRLPDDEVVVCPGVNVLILFRVNGLLVFQPFHLSEDSNVHKSLKKKNFPGAGRWAVRAYGRELYLTFRGATMIFKNLYSISHPFWYSQDMNTQATKLEAGRERKYPIDFDLFSKNAVGERKDCN